MDLLLLIRESIRSNGGNYLKLYLITVNDYLQNCINGKLNKNSKRSLNSNKVAFNQ
jgi:hypothetical protein